MKITKTTKENLQGLKAYTKDEIIEAMANHFNADKLSKDILYICKQKRGCKIFAEHDKALKAEISARNKYCEWLKEICVKYGDGEKVKISELPMEEITYGVKLENALKTAEKKQERLDKKINEILGIGGINNEK